MKKTSKKPKFPKLSKKWKKAGFKKENIEEYKRLIEKENTDMEEFSLQIEKSMNNNGSIQFTI